MKSNIQSFLAKPAPPPDKRQKFERFGDRSRPYLKARNPYRSDKMFCTRCYRNNHYVENCNAVTARNGALLPAKDFDKTQDKTIPAKAQSSAPRLLGTK